MSVLRRLKCPMPDCRRIQPGADPVRVNYDCLLTINDFLEDTWVAEAAIGLFGVMDSLNDSDLVESSVVPCCQVVCVVI
jgi:hypothetical protein